MNSTAATERFSRLQKRKAQGKTSEADHSSTSTNAKRKCQDDSTSDDQVQNKSICLESEAVLKVPVHTVQQHQVHLVIQEKESEMSHADRPNRSIYSFQYYKEDTTVAFYTGLPNLNVLKLVFKFIENHVAAGKSLSREQEYLLCLVKLRMNYLFKDIAFQLNISVATVHRSFHNILDILYARLSFLIKWPTRENLRESMPMTFRDNFGKKVVVVLDCFELFTERPSSTVNKVYTYSNYKHHQTVKYLIGIAPQGVITYISDGWGGRTSDKYITEKSGLLENLLPGDVVMVDRGFNIEESVNFYQAELAIPNFTRGKTQLHPMAVEKTRKIAAVRIHVERVIGLLVRKFRIFEGVVPVDFMKLRSGETTPTIDKIVKVACCLTNLNQSVVPFD